MQNPQPSSRDSSNSSLPPYRVILCRFNEINLKSPQYEERLVSILKEHMSTIFKREKIESQSISYYRGGLICFFPEEQISDVLKVFPYFPGIHSYSPALNTPRKERLLIKSLIRYGLSVLKDGDSYNTRYKTHIEKLPFEQIQKIRDELNTHILQAAHSKQIQPDIEYNTPNYIFEVEIRKEGSFIFHEKYESRLGGLPLETNNAILAPFPMEQIEEQARFMNASLLTFRRGFIITPIVFATESLEDIDKFQELKHSIQNNPVIQELSKYYAENLKVLLISMKNLSFQEVFDNVRTKLKSLKQKYEQYKQLFRWYLYSKMCESLILESRKKTYSYYGQRKLHYKAVLSYFDINRDYANIYISSQCKVPFFYPLSGLDEGIPSVLKERLPVGNLEGLEDKERGTMDAWTDLNYFLNYPHLLNLDPKIRKAIQSKKIITVSSTILEK